MNLLLIKAVVSIIIVISLIFISERNPKLGGLLAGLPIGSGIMMFFYGIEQGTEFVIQGIPYSIAGLLATLSFGIGFYMGGKLFLNNSLLHVTSALISGLICFFTVSFVLSLLKLTLFFSIIIFVIGTILAFLFFEHIPIEKKTIPKKITIAIVLFRCLIITIIILSITGFAKIIGANWAGLMASFPTGLFPLMAILAYSYKNEVYPTVLRNFSYSVTTLVFFYLCVLWLFPVVDVYFGTLLAYGVCFIYLYLLNKLKLGTILSNRG